MSKEAILKTIKANKPGFSALPELPEQFNDPKTLIDNFTESAKAAGGEIIKKEDVALDDFIKDYFKDVQNIVSISNEYENSDKITDFDDPHKLKDVDLAIIDGKFGVAENGAIWVDGKESKHRVLPFIAEHLVIVLPEKELVENMHQAYNLLENKVSKFGVFIAGPSKTADIEQSLVIGAHGPKSLVIYLT